MADKEGTIYYKSVEYFDFDKAYNFLVKEGFSLFDKPSNGDILALDDEGDDYLISYEETKQKALGENLFNVKLWLNYQIRIIWTFRREENCLIQDFYLGGLSQQEKDLVSKIFFKFFLHELSSNPKSLLGMFIDKNGQTYDYSFDPFFLTNEEDIDYVVDLICSPKEKLKLIKIEPGFAVKDLNNGYVCVSRYPEFLDYLLS